MGFSRQEYWSGVPLPSPKFLQIRSSHPRDRTQVYVIAGGFLYQLSYQGSPDLKKFRPPSSLPSPSLWVVPVHQPQASSIVHRTWTGNSFHTWYFTCFNAILPNLPTLALSHYVWLFCNPMDCSLPGSFVHGISLARIPEWVAISFSRGSSQPRDWTQVSRITGRHLTVWATREAHPQKSQTKTTHTQKKLQANITDEHRCKTS